MRSSVMLTFVGYIPLRRGLLQHLQEGRITLREFDVFIVLLMWADHRTGIATTNAAGLVFLSGGQLEQSWTQKCLASLEDKGYIKRPFFVQGQRGDQRIFIDKFVVTDGVLKGRVLNFAKTTDWNIPAYIDLTEDVTESAGGNADSNKKLRTDKEEGKRVSVRKTGLRENQLSETKTNPNTLSSREVMNYLGGKEVEPPPVHPKSAATAAPRTDKQVIGDRYALAERWPKLMASVESPKGVNLLDPEWYYPGRVDMERLLTSTPDSIETILSAAQWGIETSNYWFKAATKGILRSFTDFVNAYAPISKQYHNYLAATREGASA
jgi:hypothetical protein